MKSKLDRIISIATLAALLVAIGLMLRRPAPVAPLPKASAGIAANPQSTNPQSLNENIDRQDSTPRQAQQTLPTQASGAYPAAPYPAQNQSAQNQPAQNQPAPQSTKAEAHISPEHISSSEVSAAISQILGATGAGLSPDANVGSGMPNIKDQKVTYDGDTVHGQFLTEIGGKDVWITISGHMGQKDGYATFDPTEFKVGDVNVPVALVNPALQRKLAEEKDRLKLSEPAK
jgi:hypothetical protein